MGRKGGIIARGFEEIDGSGRQRNKWEMDMILERKLDLIFYFLFLFLNYQVSIRPAPLGGCLVVFFQEKMLMSCFTVAVLIRA